MKLGKIFISVFVFLFVFTGSVNAFSFELPRAGITPESPFYFLDQTFEGIGNFFTFGEENKARRRLSIAEERLSEAKELAEKGSDKIEEALSNYENKIEGLFEEGNFSSELLEGIASSTSGHMFVLNNLEESSFENQASSTLEKIMQRIEKTKEKTMDAHKKYVEKLSEEDPEKAMNVFSRTLQNKIKNLENKTEVEMSKNWQKMQNRFQENVDYMNFGEEISEMAKGLRVGDTTVDELIEKAKSNGSRALEEAKERMEEKTGKSFGEIMGNVNTERNRNEKGSSGAYVEEDEGEETGGNEENVDNEEDDSGQQGSGSEEGGIPADGTGVQNGQGGQ